MDKYAIIDLFLLKYDSFVHYMNGLTAEEYAYRYEEKWTAEQQLEHIVLCVKPLVQVYSMNKDAIRQTFGSSDRPGISYETLFRNYLAKLKDGGKAPERFVPSAALSVKKEELLRILTKSVKELCSKVDSFTEQELDCLLIPHPLLGNLTLREMLYNAIYHVQHHQEMAVENLNHNKQRSGKV